MSQSQECVYIHCDCGLARWGLVRLYHVSCGLYRLLGKIAARLGPERTRSGDQIGDAQLQSSRRRSCIAPSWPAFDVLYRHSRLRVGDTIAKPMTLWQTTTKHQPAAIAKLLRRLWIGWQVHALWRPVFDCKASERCVIWRREIYTSITHLWYYTSATTVRPFFWFLARYKFVTCLFLST